MFGLRLPGFNARIAKGQAENSGAQADVDPAPGGLATGMVVGTRVATRMGWRPVEGVLPGDMVLTFDGGMQEVVSVQRGQLWSSPRSCPRHLWPLRVSAGSLGNQAETILLPEQAVMIEADCAEAVLGDPFVLIPAAALEEFAGIEATMPTRDLDVITLHFADDQVVFANLGVLFFCPAKRGMAGLSDMLGEGGEASYDPLPLAQAEALIAYIDATNHGAAPPPLLWGAMPEQGVYAAR